MNLQRLEKTIPSSLREQTKSLAIAKMSRYLIGVEIGSSFTKTLKYTFEIDRNEKRY